MNKITDVTKIIDFLENRVESKFGVFVSNIKPLDSIKFYWKDDYSEVDIKKSLKLIPCIIICSFIVSLLSLSGAVVLFCFHNVSLK